VEANDYLEDQSEEWGIQNQEAKGSEHQRATRHGAEPTHQCQREKGRAPETTTGQDSDKCEELALAKALDSGEGLAGPTKGAGDKHGCSDGTASWHDDSFCMLRDAFSEVGNGHVQSANDPEATQAQT
jgi:hypothetical protein